MQIKVLQPSEYPLLKQAPDEFIPDPAMSIVVAAFDEDKLIGKVCLIIIPHIEGPWIAEKYRGRMIFKEGCDLLIEACKEKGLKKVFAFGATPQIESYLKRLAFSREPLSVWSKEI